MPILLIDNNRVHINIPVPDTEHMLQREWIEGEAKAHTTKAMMFVVLNCGSSNSEPKRKTMVSFIFQIKGALSDPQLLFYLSAIYRNYSNSVSPLASSSPLLPSFIHSGL